MKLNKLPTPEWVVDLPSKTSPTGKRLYEVSPGLWYPSITTVIGSEPEKVAALEAWRQAYSKDRAKARTEQASKRGTSVHDLLDREINGEDIVLDKDEVGIEIRAPFAQIKRELKTHVDTVIANEVCLFSHMLKTAGRVDLIAHWDGTPAIIDFKTADKKKTEDFIEGYFLQTTAYSLCLYEMTGQLIDDIVIIIGNEKLFKPQIFVKKIYPYVNRVKTLFEQHHARTK